MERLAITMTQNSSSHFSMEYQTERLILKVLTPDYAEDVCDFLSKNGSIFEKYEPTLPTNYYTAEHQAIILSCEMKLALKSKAPGITKTMLNKIQLEISD